MFNLKQYDWKRLNVSLIIVVTILCTISAYTINLGEGNTFFIKQMIGLVLGLIVIIVISVMDYHFICRFVGFYYIAIIGLLFLVRYTPLGTDNDTNAYRWLDLKVINLDVQPSDFAKIALILTLAVILARLQEKMDKLYVFFLLGFVTFVPTILIFLQPNLSTSIVMSFIFMTMIFAAGLSYKIVIALLSVAIPTGGTLFWYIMQPGQKLIREYQYNRIFGFLNPENENMGDILYQQIHSVSAISSGKVYGKLILEGPSDIRSYKSVAVTESDFIFSVIGEEYGFIGGCIILVLLAFVIIKCLLVAKKAADHLGMLIAIGISSMLMCQIFVNIGVSTLMLPNTGIPLPFVSYGLSSLLSNMIAIGFIINIGMQKNTRR